MYLCTKYHKYIQTDIMEHKISVVINTYNAEEKLTQVLDTVKDFDEIVICDMESTDSTLDIARKYNCKIVTFPKGEHKIVEPARQFAIDSATYKWVLVVDADELITPELKSTLYDLLKSDDIPSGTFIPRRNFFMGRPYAYPDYQLRFMNRDLTKWAPYVHAIPKVDGRIIYLPKSKKELAIIHIADDNISTRLRKINEYTDNEVIKRKGQNPGIAKLIISPIWRFLHYFIVKGGFRYGLSGFVISVINAHYKFMTIAKILESKRENKELVFNKNQKL